MQDWQRRGNPNQERPFAAEPGWAPAQAGGGLAGAGSPPPAVAAPTLDISGLIQVINEGNAKLDLILAELREQVAQGIAYSLTIVLTDLNIFPVVLPQGLFSLSLINDGPQIIQYRLPNIGAGSFINRNPTEQITFTAIKGVIKTVGLRVLAPLGAGATVRLEGFY